MSNGIDFKAMALDLRAQLNACEQSKADLLEAIEDIFPDVEYAIDDITGMHLLCDDQRVKVRLAVAQARGKL